QSITLFNILPLLASQKTTLLFRGLRLPLNGHSQVVASLGPHVVTACFQRHSRHFNC
ncbi:hypothetical protein BDR06DRAFT_916839, partial [Suillus hirtellus]